ncbi:hypothetical protein [Marinobacterium stanieri]|uniref:hypothetical protein n=1 Tax=Marinobacterium stanieri TaxID=49186 RepID=UPI000255880E|nr:hypothetical protein [Marinobacterium stanieri]
MDKLPGWVNDHVEYIENLNLDEKHIEDINNDIEGYGRSQVPYLMMSQFMRFSWTGVIETDMKSGWLERTVNPNIPLEERRQGTLDFYDESDLNAIHESLKNIYDKGVSEEDLLKVIRESQKNILGSIFMMVDGTTDGCHGTSLFETEWKGDELVAKRRFFNMEDYFLDYDPARLKE